VSALATAAVAIAVAAGGGILTIRHFERSQLYRPHRDLAADPRAAGLDFEDVEFVAEDGVRLHGWWIPSPGARGTVVYCHGNGENVGDLVPVAVELARLGANVFLFDYRGYGRSAGRPSEQGTYRDARAAYEVVRARYADAEAPPVVAMGHSLGAAVALQLALDKPVRGLVLESAFASTVRMSREVFPRLPAETFVRYRYDNAAKGPRVSVPLLSAHSPQDEVVPVDQGRDVHRRVPGPKRWVDLRGGHNDFHWETSPGYRAAVGAFLADVLPAPAAGR
jgi:pimeloyl-ACP methyl ester carboxylesterase